ncbi:MAG: type II secretion system F family protein [Synechococcales cyanobacterium RU_4_20]|nr:type II secretion system F family protein [Synechococcales cyanobacterium RU_4_20]NJR68422.1 type II secretion system F family protein [Synechococcales cyanobacterium CRU_2_2]
MATFVAQIRDGQGNFTKQKVQADNAREARSLLRSQGLFVQDVTESKGFNLEELGKVNLSEMTAKVTVKDKAVFSRQLSVMVNAGVPIVRSLGILSDQCPNPKLKKALIELSDDVQQGSNLSESMRKFPQSFDRLYVAMIQAGEIGGVLDEVLARLSKLLEDTARLQNQIKSAMTYPVTVGGFAVLVFLGLTIFLIPIFAGIFETLGTDLPLFTQIMVNISGFLRKPLNMVVVFAVIAGLAFAFRQYYRTPVGRKTIDQLSLKVPLFGDLIQKNAVARFSRTFGSLTRAGVPMLTSLEIVRDTAGNQIIADAIDHARVEVQSGGMISTALAQADAFPTMSIQMMMIGEETGELDAMLMKVADFYEDEVEQAVKAMTSIMEPIMIVVVGGMVGIILLSMYLPMFKVFNDIG